MRVLAGDAGPAQVIGHPTRARAIAQRAQLGEVRRGRAGRSSRSTATRRASRWGSARRWRRGSRAAALRLHVVLAQDLEPVDRRPRSRGCARSAPSGDRGRCRGSGGRSDWPRAVVRTKARRAERRSRAARALTRSAFRSGLLQPPWPLQSFWPLQACLSVLQPPCPLQSFCPLQACFAAAPAGMVDAADVVGAVALVDAADVVGAVAALPVAADGSAAGGFDPPHPVAPTRIPLTAAVINE